MQCSSEWFRVNFESESFSALFSKTKTTSKKRTQVLGWNTGRVYPVVGQYVLGTSFTGHSWVGRVTQKSDDAKKPVYTVIITHTLKSDTTSVGSTVTGVKGYRLLGLKQKNVEITAFPDNTENQRPEKRHKVSLENE